MLMAPIDSAFRCLSTTLIDNDDLCVIVSDDRQSTSVVFFFLSRDLMMRAFRVVDTLAVSFSLHSHPT